MHKSQAVPPSPPGDSAQGFGTGVPLRLPSPPGCLQRKVLAVVPGNYVVNVVFLFRQGWEWEPLLVSVWEKNAEAFTANCLIVFIELILK